jgi:M6 family metalloprotease-like protein
VQWQRYPNVAPEWKGLLTTTGEVRVKIGDAYLLGSYRIVTAPETNSSDPRQRSSRTILSCRSKREMVHTRGTSLGGTLSLCGFGSIGRSARSLASFLEAAMSFNLADYGYDTMRTHDLQARGERSLLVILCTLSGPVGAPFVDRYQLFGKADDRGWRNLRDYFRSVSCGRFTWKPAQTSFFSVELDKLESQTTFVERLPILYEDVKKQDRDFFKAFDSNHDGEVRYGELSILVVDNGDSGIAQAGTDGPAIRVADQTASGDNSVGYSFIGTPNSLCWLAHELSHIVGTHDLYGPDSDLNGGASLMGQIQGGDGYASYHLDPWHKMRLGWAEPRIYELKPGQPIFLHAAGQERPDGAVIVFDRGKDPYEFFMLEFRNNHPDVAKTYDRNVHDTGLVIWRIKTDFEHEPAKVLVQDKGD